MIATVRTKPRRAVRRALRHGARARRALPMFRALAELITYHLDTGAAAIESDDAPLAYDARILRGALAWFDGWPHRPDADLVLLLRKLAEPPPYEDLDDLPPMTRLRVQLRYARYRHLAIAVGLLHPALDCLAVHVTTLPVPAGPTVTLEALRCMHSMLEGQIVGLLAPFANVQKLVARTLAGCARQERPTR